LSDNGFDPALIARRDSAARFLTNPVWVALHTWLGAHSVIYSLFRKNHVDLIFIAKIRVFQAAVF